MSLYFADVEGQCGKQIINNGNESRGGNEMVLLPVGGTRRGVVHV